MTETDWDHIHKKLNAPFPQDQVKLKCIDKKNDLYAQYITAEMVQDRLDETVGPDGWSDSYRTIDETGKAVECRLAIRGIPKTDVGYPNLGSDAADNAREPWKAAYSDALKRAAVKWGIGRYLNYLPIQRGKGRGAEAQEESPRGSSFVDIRRAQPLPEAAGEHADRVSEVTARDVQRSMQNPSGRSQEAMAARTQAARPVPASPGTASSFPAASPHKTATPNQMATIAKLSRLLGEKGEPDGSISSAEASEMIADLSRRYNDRKSVPTR